MKQSSDVNLLDDQLIDDVGLDRSSWISHGSTDSTHSIYVRFKKKGLAAVWELGVTFRGEYPFRALRRRVVSIDANTERRLFRYRGGHEQQNDRKCVLGREKKTAETSNGQKPQVSEIRWSPIEKVSAVQKCRVRSGESRYNIIRNDNSVV